MKNYMPAVILLLLTINCCSPPKEYAGVGEIRIINNFTVHNTQEPPGPENQQVKIRLNTKVQTLSSATEPYDGWQKVNVLAKDSIRVVGWVDADVVLSGTPTNKWGAIKYPHSEIDIYSSQDKSSKILSRLERNQRVKAFSFKSDWYAIFAEGDTTLSESMAIGYVPSSKLHDSEAVLPFKIVGGENVSYAGTPRMTKRVILQVDKVPSEKEMKDVAKAIWKNGNTSWKEFTVFLYLEGMPSDDIAYGVAEFRPNGLKDFSVSNFVLDLYGNKWKK